MQHKRLEAWGNVIRVHTDVGDEEEIAITHDTEQAIRIVAAYNFCLGKSLEYLENNEVMIDVEPYAEKSEILLYHLYTLKNREKTAIGSLNLKSMIHVVELREADNMYLAFLRYDFNTERLSTLKKEIYPVKDLGCLSENFFKNKITGFHSFDKFKKIRR